MLVLLNYSNIFRINETASSTSDDDVGGVMLLDGEKSKDEEDELADELSKASVSQNSIQFY